jgi:hypothetical protein
VLPPKVDDSGLRISTDEVLDERFFFAGGRTFLPDTLRPADCFARAVTLGFCVDFFFFALLLFTFTCVPVSRYSILFPVMDVTLPIGRARIAGDGSIIV